MLYGSFQIFNYSVIYWYENIWQTAPELSEWYEYCRLTVIKDQFVLALGNTLNGTIVRMLDVFLKSPRWIPMMNMLVSREKFGVGTLDNCVYAVSRNNILHILSYNNIFYNN